MREIKFRAWDKNNNFEIFTFDNMRVADYLHKKSKPYIWINGGPVDLNDCIIEQFTGLHDKNGKEIHEGDICNVDDGENLYEIIFYRGGFMVAVLPRKIRIYHIGDSLFNNIEIIGNIHKNPELLS